MASKTNSPVHPFWENKHKAIILDDNELSIASYAEEYPENFKKICDNLDKMAKPYLCPNCKKINYRSKPIHKNTETICHYCKTKFNAYKNYYNEKH